MAKTAAQLINRYRSDGLFIDTNLLLLLVIGTFRRDMIATHKRVNQYNTDDFQKVAFFRGHFQTLWTTPSVLTETDNLGRQMAESNYQGFAKTMTSLSLQLIEQYVPFKDVAQTKIFTRLGLSDASILLTKTSKLILTDDLNLHAAALGAGFDSINLNHLRYDWR